MIRLLGKIPRKIHVAVSGGVDSMVLFHFLSNNHEVKPVFIHHRTENSAAAYDFLVKTLVDQQNHSLEVYSINKNKPKELSDEEHWRNERYNYLSKFECVVTGHHLDDAVETWIWSSLHGTSSLIPYTRNNVIRPLLLTRKQCLYDYAKRKNISWIEDASNNDTDYTRNYIRHQLMPHVLKVNPGIHTMIRKKLEQRQKLSE